MSEAHRDHGTGRHLPVALGRAVRVDPIKPTLKGAGTKLLKLTYYKLLSTSAFKLNLRRYTSEDAAVVGGNVLTSQRVTDVCLAAFKACANSQGQGLTLAHFSAQLIVFNGIGGARRGWVAHVKGVLGGV